MGIFGGSANHSATGETDEDLLQAHIAGDPYAFEALFHRHRGQLFRLAHITSRNADDAADALQEAWLSAHQNAPHFRRDSSVSSWLYRIVVNACLDRLRRNRIYAAKTIEDRSQCKADPIHRIDMTLVVERALMRLPVDQRAAVVAVDMQGYSVAETAHLLGVPEGTVKSRCARARAKLAQSLAL